MTIVNYVLPALWHMLSCIRMRSTSVPFLGLGLAKRVQAGRATQSEGDHQLQSITATTSDGRLGGLAGGWQAGQETG